MDDAYEIELAFKCTHDNNDTCSCCDDCRECDRTSNLNFAKSFREAAEKGYGEVTMITRPASLKSDVD